MNPLVLYFASGESLYPGAALLLMTVATSPYLKRRWLMWLRSFATWLALGLIVMACPPFAWIIDVVFAAAFWLWLIAWNRTAPTLAWSKLQIVSAPLLLVLLLTLPIVELSYRRMPVICGQASDHLVVIGDSISSGLGPRGAPWPVVMQHITGVEIRNLSMPGATMTDGLAMADRVYPEDHLILIELGGNDLIAGEPSDTFARALDGVLAKLAAPGRTVVMFELPLLPQRVAYGQIQRRLAAKYGVALIPKRYFTRVIAGRDATLDGLHLTEVGTHRMASLVAQILLPLLKTKPAASTTPARHP
ncbi:MAG: GDSL-type esterase/lipase family protein [Candidatus Sulfotelmatobacter sp.]